MSFDSLSINYDRLNGFKALFVILNVLLKEIISFGNVVLVVETSNTATLVVAIAASSKTVTVELQALRLLAITGWNFRFFLKLFSL